MRFKASHVNAWAAPRDLAELERALDAGRLLCLMAHKRYWRVTRAGPTERNGTTWRVPVRAGLTVRGEATPSTLTVYRVRPGASAPRLTALDAPARVH